MSTRRLFQTTRRCLSTTSSSSQTAIEIGPTSLSRFREHYNQSLADDVMYLTYTHDQEHQVQKPLRGWDESNPYSENRPARPPRGNKPLKPLSQPRTPENVPEVYKVDVHAMVKNAITNKFALLSAVMAIQAITGKKPEIRYAKKGVATWKLRQGMPIACKATLTGTDMYAFLSTLFEIVLPRSKDFAGFPIASGDGTGNISFGLTSQGLAQFPEIEASFEMYPALTGFHITIGTTAVKDSEARLLLSGFGAPFVKRR